MNILILGLNYSPELTSIGPYTTGLAEHLSSAGHKVKVVTGFPTAPQWEVWKGYKGRRFMREVLNGIPVLRTYLYVPKDPRKASVARFCLTPPLRFPLSPGYFPVRGPIWL